jgi:hypothetical protein
VPGCGGAAEKPSSRQTGSGELTETLGKRAEEEGCADLRAGGRRLFVLKEQVKGNPWAG